MDDNSTISWMIMGGPRYDEHSQDERHLGHIRALRDTLPDQGRARSSSTWLTRLVGFLDGWTGRPAKALTADFCTVEPCVAA